MSNVPEKPVETKKDPPIKAIVVIGIIVVVWWNVAQAHTTTAPTPAASYSSYTVTPAMIVDAMGAKTQGEFCQALATVGYSAGETAFSNSYGYQPNAPSAAAVYAELARRC